MTTNQNTNQYAKQGFDFDPELIDLFDAILQNIHDEGELKEEFSKLKFIKKLEGTFNSRPGPLKQLIEKMATMERDFRDVKLDMQRATSDLNSVIREIKNMAQATSREQMVDHIDRIQSIGTRNSAYSWNYNGK